jgi:hypothetical protein
LLVGCGTATRVDFAGHTRPASPLDVSVFLGAGGIRLEPRSVRPGPVELLVTNQTKAPRTVDVTAGGRAVYSSSQPLPSEGTAQFKLTLKSGSYAVGVAGRTPSPYLHVSGRPRNADREVTQP